MLWAIKKSLHLTFNTVGLKKAVGSGSTIGLDNWSNKANIRIAFEPYSAIGNPLFIDNVSITTTIGEMDKPKQNESLKIFPNPTNGAF